MSCVSIEQLMEKNPILDDIRQEKEIVWINPDLTNFEMARQGTELTIKDIEDAVTAGQIIMEALMGMF